ncbi:MAG: hypothetical protein H3C54_13220 [Taibaiella sp.]|nr:hypothetical protein [Taibaiella sp.]
MPTNGAEISVAVANDYINDFIANYFDTGKAPVKSMILDAGLLRDYLSNPVIQNIKFMLGERTVVENGIDKKVFTLIVAGYDANGNYILTPSGNVLDHTTPCPTMCPTAGNAANDNIVM